MNYNYAKMTDYPLIQDGWEPTWGNDVVIKQFGAIANISRVLDDGKIEACGISGANQRRLFVCKKDEMLYLPRIDELLAMPLGFKSHNRCRYQWKISDAHFYISSFSVSMELTQMAVADRHTIKAKTLKAALLKAIMHSHGLKWSEGEWMKICSTQS